jgi:hypothetical protein
MSSLRIFLDSTALKLAVQRRIVRRPRRRTLQWGGRTIVADLSQFTTVDPTATAHHHQRREARRLPVIAWLSMQKRVDLFTHVETLWEFFGLPRTDDSFGRFFGATVQHVESPVQYGRVLLGAGLPRSKQLQTQFLMRITHERFEQLKRATGAYQGNRPSPPNELADTFHIWCAEAAAADVFLTLDTDLADLVRLRRQQPPRPQVLLPSETLQLARERGLFSSNDYSNYRLFRRRLLRGRSDHPLEDWVERGRRLEVEGKYDS